MGSIKPHFRSDVKVNSVLYQKLTWEKLKVYYLLNETKLTEIMHKTHFIQLYHPKRTLEQVIGEFHTLCLCFFLQRKTALGAYTMNLIIRAPHPQFDFAVSATCSQLWSENIKWIFLEINTSYILDHVIF